jgi:flagellar hook-associated protein 1 FlgK
MGTSIFSIGISGLNAAQAGLQTTSHNISNAATPGFSRQQIIQASNTPQFTGAGFLGQGTNVATVQRMYSTYLNSAVQSAQASVSQLNAYQAQISQIDNMLADPNAGLSPALSQFFSAANVVSSNPSSMPARQSMLSAAQALVSRFQGIDQNLSQIRTGINTQVTSEVATINSIATQIAEVNQKIILAQASGPNQPANDLLDQRDQLVAQLNQHVSATTVAQSDGTYSVFIGSGQPLVVGTNAATLQALPATNDPNRTVVALQLPGGQSMYLQESLLTGGSLGGLLAFRAQSLDQAQNAVGRVAIAMAQTVNAQHQLGQDLTGALGGNFFNMASPVVIPSSINTGGTSLTATLGSASALTTSDYTLNYSGGIYTLTRLSDNVSWSGGSASGVATAAAQGFSLTISGTPANGDSFQIQPTRMGANSIGVLVTDPRNVAAAAPFVTDVGGGNSGTGSISAGSVNATPVVPDPAHPATDLNLRQPVTITFIDATHFSVTGTGVPAAASAAPYVTYTPGADITYNGWTVQISGAPAVGDSFTIGPNNSGVADGRNMLAIDKLQTTSILDGNTASYTGAYAQLVNIIGSKANQVKVTAQAQQSLLEQATAAQQSVSGVNLDEEAANLMRYQQAYQASAKVLATVGKLFDTILAINP